MSVWTPQWQFPLPFPQGTLQGRRTATMQVRALWSGSAGAAIVAQEVCFISAPSYSVPNLKQMIGLNNDLIVAPYLKMGAFPVNQDSAGNKFPQKWYEKFKNGAKAQQQGTYVNWLMESGFNAESWQAATVDGISAQSYGEWSVKKDCANVAAANVAAANQGAHPFRGLWYDTAGTFCADQTPGFWPPLSGTASNPGWNPHTNSAYGRVVSAPSGKSVDKSVWLQMWQWKGDLARNQIAAFPNINSEQLFIAANGMGGGGGGGDPLALPQHVDMAMTEGWLVKFGQFLQPGAPHFETQIQMHLDCQLIYGTVAQPLDWGGTASTATVRTQQRRYVAAANLLAARGYNTFEWMGCKSGKGIDPALSQPDLETALDPNLYAMDLGTPLSGHSPDRIDAVWPNGHRVPVGAGTANANTVGLYGRLYDGGAVLVNPGTAASINFVADRTYRTVPTLQSPGTVSYSSGGTVPVPPQHAVFLTATGGSGGSAPTALWLPQLLGDAVENQIVYEQPGRYSGNPTVSRVWQQAAAGTGPWSAITGQTLASFQIPIGSSGTAGTYAAAAFAGTSGSGLLAADSGGTWTYDQGAAADWDQTGGRARASHSAANTFKTASLPLNVADLDAQIDVSFPGTAAGGNLQGGLLLRWQDTSNYMRVNLVYSAANAAVSAVAEKIVAGSATTIGTSKNLGTVPAGNAMTVRMRLQGNNIKMMAGTALPGSWDVDITDAPITAAGKVALRSQRGTGNTNTSPQVRFDNLVVSALSGTASSSYLGTYLRTENVVITGGGTITTHSDVLGPVMSGLIGYPVFSGQPSISGVARETAELTGIPGLVQAPGAAGTVLGYQWRTSASGSAGSWSDIAGGTTQIQALSVGDAGGFRRFEEIAAGSGGTVHGYSNMIGPITASPAGVTPGTVSLAGTPVVGGTATMTTTAWSGTPTPILTGKFQSSADDGATWLDLTQPKSFSGSQNYVYQAADYNKLVRGYIEGNNGLFDAIATSDTVGPVQLPIDFPGASIAAVVE